MVFLDTNSWLMHHELNQDRQELKDNRAYFLKEIQNDKRTLERLKDSTEIEKFARENYYMKRPNEEIFIIEYQDSLK
jgi:cell division protein FtsB